MKTFTSEATISPMTAIMQTRPSVERSRFVTVPKTAIAAKVPAVAKNAVWIVPMS